MTVTDRPPERWTDGVRVGVDVGTVRVGVAASDPGGVLASPLATLARDPRGTADLDKLAREDAEALASRVDPVPVRLSDERLTTVAATRRLAEGGIRGRKGRQVVDRSAAVLILQGWLDAARRNS